MVRFWGLVGVAMLSQACLTTGMYRTAHVLPEGEGDLALTVSVVRARTDDITNLPGDQSLTYNFPNIIPEVSYHFGVGNDFEIGGRVALGAGMIEADAKYRFFGSDATSTHLALQPALGYRSLGLIEGYHASLPLLFTVDLNHNIAVNTSVFGTFVHYGLPDEFDAENNINFAGESAAGGAGVALELSTASGFHFMPGLEVQRILWRGGDFADAPSITSIIFAVTFGWGPDEDLKALNRVEQKVDAVDDKVEQVNQQLIDG